MQKLLMIILLILGFGLCSVAQVDNKQSFIHTDANGMFIIGNGIGKSVEQAKIATINDILRQLSDKEIMASLPNSYTNTESSAKDNVVIISQGLETLFAKLYIEGKWQLKDESYHYSIEILIQNEMPETDTK